MSTLTRQFYGMWFEDVNDGGGARPPMFDHVGNGTGDYISDLSVAKARGMKVILKFHGSPRNILDASGRFSMASYERMIDRAADRAPVAQVHNFVLDGTLLAHEIIDDAKDGSPVFNGVPPTRDEMDAMCAYSKSKWSLLPTCIRIDNIWLKQKSNWTNADFAWCQWHVKHKAPLQWFVNNVNDGRSVGLGFLAAFNLLHGGSGLTEPWTYTDSGGGGTGAVMSPMEIDAVGAAFSATTYAIGILGWAANDLFDRSNFYDTGQGVQDALSRLANRAIGKVMGPINWRGDMPWMNPAGSGSTSTDTTSGSTVTVVGGWIIRDNGAGTVTRKNNTQNIIVPAPAVYEPGDLHLLFAHSRDSARSFLTPSGWSLAKAVSGNSAQGGQLALFYKIGSETETDVTLTADGTVDAGQGASELVRWAVVSNNTSVTANLAVAGSAATWAAKTGMGPVPGMTSTRSDSLVVICAARCDDFGGGSVEENKMSATTGPQSWLRLFSMGNVSGVDNGMFVDIAATAGLESITTKSWTQTSGVTASGAGAGFMVAFAPVSVVSGQPAAFETEFNDAVVVSLNSNLSFTMVSRGSTPFTYSKVSGPSNVTVNSSTGRFDFTPTSAGTYVILLRTSNSFGSDTGQLTVFAASTAGGGANNTAPVITHPGNMTVAAQHLLAFGLSATDSDGDVLEYGLESGAPAGVFLDQRTGQFVWIPTGEQGPGTYPMVATVTDGQAESRSTFTVTVTDVPWTRVRGSGGGFGDTGTTGNSFRRI
jgi:hypothetical protein